MGRLIEKKGIVFLLDVVQQLKNTIEFELDICGNGCLNNEVRRIIDECGLNDCVNMRGEIPHDQVTEYYQNADVFVLPSLRETGGTVLIEAMAYALPIVAFNTSFCTQLNEQKCGIFVNANQELEGIRDEFCNALVRLAEDRQLCEDLGRNGYKFVNDELTWTKKYEAIVKDV